MCYFIVVVSSRVSWHMPVSTVNQISVGAPSLLKFFPLIFTQKTRPTDAVRCELAIQFGHQAGFFRLGLDQARLAHLLVLYLDLA